MFVRLLSIETRKALKHPLVWLELAGVLGLFALFFAARYAFLTGRQGPTAPRGLELDLQEGLSVFNFLSVLLATAPAALICAYDFLDGGVKLWLARGVPRPLLLLARLAVCLAFGLGLAGLAVAASVGAAALMQRLFLGAVTFDLDWPQLGPTVLRLFWGIAPYVVLTALLAVLSRSPFAAAGGTVLYRVLLENELLHLAGYLPALGLLLPAQLASVLERHAYPLNQAAQALSSGGPALTELQAAVNIGGLLVLLSAAALILFCRQDWGG